jgi:hypothetical protein
VVVIIKFITLLYLNHDYMAVILHWDVGDRALVDANRFGRAQHPTPSGHRQNGVQRIVLSLGFFSIDMRLMFFM